MDVSVVIPTYGRPEKLRRCLEHLARQETRRTFEVVVGVDGGAEDAQGVDAITAFAERTLGRACRVMPFEKLGYIAVRHRLVGLAKGEVLLSLNDDSYASPGLIESHASVHDRLGPERCVVTGPAPWERVEEPTLFDRVVQQTDLVFFRAPEEATSSDGPAVGYRDVYGLNMSAATALVRGVGGFPDVRDAYGYDDIELAFRLQRDAGCRLVYNPAAAVTHDHRMSPADVMRREYLLGRSAWVYAGLNGAFAEDVFGRDIRSDEEVSFCEVFMRQGRGDAERIERAMLELDVVPAGEDHDAVVRFVAEGWRGLKRYLWRWGLLDASRGAAERWGLLSEGAGPA